MAPTTIDPVEAAFADGRRVPRAWTPTSTSAYFIESDGTVGEQVPAEYVTRALELAAARGQQRIGVMAHGTPGGDAMWAISGALGLDVAAAFCGPGGTSAAPRCPEFAYPSLSAGQSEHVVFEGQVPVGIVYVVYESQPGWIIAVWDRSAVRPGGSASTVSTAGPPAPAAPATDAPVECTTASPIRGSGDGFPMARGSSGPNVRLLQQALLIMGFDLGSAGADGQFGVATQRAVCLAQASIFSQPATGVLDQGWWTTIVASVEDDSEQG